MPHRPRDRSRRLAILLTVVLVATTVLAGPASAGGAALSPASPAPAAPTATPRYDGEALFRGLFFHQGPVAARHPELSRLPAAPTGASARLTDRLMASMRQLEPGFFAAFEADVTSGDRFRVRAALARAGKLLATAAERVGVGTIAKEVDPRTGTCVYIALTVAVAGNIIVAINAAVAGNVFLLVNLSHTVNFNRSPEKEPPEPESSLARDQWVEQVAVTLAR